MGQIIDFHTHIFPDQIAEHAISSLEEVRRIKSCKKGTLKELIDSMNWTGIERSVLMPVSTKEDQVKSINDFAISLADHPRVVSFGTIHPQFEEFKSEIERLKNAGVIGVKFHPEFQEFYPDEERMFPIYEEFIKQDMIAFFHAGRDIGFTDVHGTPEKFARVKKTLPKLKLILAHMGGFLMWREVERELAGKDVFFETSFTIDFMSPYEFHRLVDRLGHDRVMFGTDFPWKDQSDQMHKFRMIIKNAELRKKIVFDNPQKVLNLT